MGAATSLTRGGRHAAVKAEREVRVAKQRKRQPKVPTVEQGGG